MLLPVRQSDRSGVNVLNGMLGNKHEVSFIFAGLNNVNTADTRPTGGSLHSGTSPCCRCCLHRCSIYTRDTTAPRCLSLSVFQLTYPHIFLTEKPPLHIQPICRSFILKTTLCSLENNLHWESKHHHLGHRGLSQEPACLISPIQTWFFHQTKWHDAFRCVCNSPKKIYWIFHPFQAETRLKRIR